MFGVPLDMGSVVRVFNPSPWIHSAMLPGAPSGAADFRHCCRRSSFFRAINKNRLSGAQDMSVEAMVQKMIDDLTAALGDAAKHDKGNAAAGTRVRKAMQEAKAAAQDVRVKVQSDKNA
jgi:hypothetical protein